jgi:hypothetical protein
MAVAVGLNPDFARAVLTAILPQLLRVICMYSCVVPFSWSILPLYFVFFFL